jgi:formamidopyrimidine-DNA glycosylase
MPELPEITCRAREMHDALVGRTITAITVVQPKSLNMPEEEFISAVTGSKILNATNRGKWIFIETTQGWVLLNLGMGGEILLVPCCELPEKLRIVFVFENEECLSINFWWFGYVHYAPLDKLSEHKMTAKLGPNALDLTANQLKKMIQGRRGRVKSFLLDQTKMAGIGNAYVHDILFLAGLHPLRPLNTLGEVEIDRLAQAIQRGLAPSLDKGGAFYEVNIYGQKGGFTMDDILIGYMEGKPCPVCGTIIEKIKTGSTSSFICLKCQPEV